MQNVDNPETKELNELNKRVCLKSGKKELETF